MRQYDVAVVGGGIVGLSTARHLNMARPDLRVVVLEKEPAIALHQSSRNSGVIHTGLYYKPGTHKARLAVEGAREMLAYCRERGIAHRVCGKVVVAVNEREQPFLHELQRRAAANGVAGVELIDVARLRELEPQAAGAHALWVPGAAITSFRAVAEFFAREFTDKGGEIVVNAELQEVRRLPGGWGLGTTIGDIEAGVVVNCAGLHCDLVARLFGVQTDISIMPFRGEYYQLSAQAQSKVNNLIYPVPDPQLPFLGVHLTRSIDGTVEAGPNAVLAWAREGYRKMDVDWQDCMDMLGNPGAWRLFMRHWQTAVAEQARSWSKARFLAAVCRLLPTLRADELIPATSGIRAQAVRRDGRLVDDFEWKVSFRSLHLLNAPSPAATASIPIGRLMAAKAVELFTSKS